MRQLLYNALFLAGIFGAVTSVSPTPRLYSGCTYLRRKIYCYGGVDRADAGIQADRLMTMDDFYYLDISGNFAVSNASSAWVEINAEGGLQPEPNAFYSMGKISENNTIVISGGLGRNDRTLLVNPTIAYNVITNTWFTMSGNSGNQVYAAANAQESNNSLYIWGGVSDAATGYGFQDYEPDMRILDLIADQWRRVDLYARIPTRVYHTSTLGNDQRSIYFIGGQAQTYVTAENGTSYYEKTLAPMNSILVFDTSTSMWATRNTTGITPSSRLWHTAELKPNTNEIVVYGGAIMLPNSTEPAEDFCYVLDTTSMSWTIINLNKDEGAGIRSDHSAVFLEDSTLMFIMFGMNENADGRADVQVLNTDSWQWVQNYEGPGPLPNDNQDESGSGSSGLSGGAIAGIVIGVVATIVIIVGALFFIRLQRRRRQQSSHHVINNNSNMSPPRYSNDIKMENEIQPFNVATTLSIQQQAQYYPTAQGLAPPPAQHYAIAQSDGRLSPISSRTRVAGTTTTIETNTIPSPQQQRLVGETSSPQRLSVEIDSPKPDGSHQEQQNVLRMTLSPVKPDGSG
ncbi:hypothetical protein BDA99DRAFT_528094 [Phascolomyces articulosus]|uniref:Galactose oxidase n=1 Tax=Phascolomyces articulosus TaxID=60185 RepID=A0AAD5JLS4_9FUNG|nr:hypothetical protein BDA99DRAFT_528094 [Phascolomyces articulosus]